MGSSTQFYRSERGSAAFSLLADHLDTVLRHGEVLRAIEIPQAISAFAGPGVGSMIKRGRSVDTAASEAHALELAIILRLRQAQETARSASAEFGGPAAALLRLVASAADLVATVETSTTTANASAFLASRGIAREQTSIGEDYLIGGTVRLGDVMDAVAAALDTMDVLAPQK